MNSKYGISLTPEAEKFLDSFPDANHSDMDREQTDNPVNQLQSNNIKDSENNEQPSQLSKYGISLTPEEEKFLDSFPDANPNNFVESDSQPKLEETQQEQSTFNYIVDKLKGMKDETLARFKPFFEGMTESTADVILDVMKLIEQYPSQFSQHGKPYSEERQQQLQELSDKFQNIKKPSQEVSDNFAYMSNGRSDRPADKTDAFIKGAGQMMPWSRAGTFVGGLMNLSGDIAENNFGANQNQRMATELATGITPALAIKGTGKVVEKMWQKGMNKHLEENANRIDTKTYDAAQRQGVDVGRNVIDKTPITNVAEIAANHALLSTQAQKQQLNKTRKTYHDAVERNLDRTSVKKTIENQEQADELYKRSKALLTNKDTVNPQMTISAVKQARERIKDISFVTEKGEENFIKYLNKLENSMHRNQVSDILDKHGQKITNEAYKNATSTGEVQVNKLIGEKQKLYKKYTNVFGKESHEVKDELNKITAAIREDVNVFGKTNPKFYELNKNADNLYANMERREDLKGMLKHKEFYDPEIDFNYRKFADNFSQVKDNKYFIKFIGGKQNLKNFEDLVRISRAIPTNLPTNLATNMKILAAIATGLAIAGGSGSAAKSAIVALSMDKRLKAYIGNKKAVARMVQYAKDPTAKNLKIVNNTYKNEFGKSVDEVNSELKSFINSLSEKDRAIMGVSAIKYATNSEDE